ncbi:hypothetical protein N9L68_03995, partial [bacterium]|nr:hypothetical protein [bacterium]
RVGHPVRGVHGMAQRGDPRGDLNAITENASTRAYVLSRKDKPGKWFPWMSWREAGGVFRVGREECAAANKDTKLAKFEVVLPREVQQGQLVRHENPPGHRSCERSSAKCGGVRSGHRQASQLDRRSQTEKTIRDGVVFGGIEAGHRARLGEERGIWSRRAICQEKSIVGYDELQRGGL